MEASHPLLANPPAMMRVAKPTGFLLLFRDIGGHFLVVVDGG